MKTMDAKTVRVLMHLCLAIIGLSLILMLVNFFGNRPGPAFWKKVTKKEGGEAGLFHALPQYAGVDRSFLPSVRQGLSTVSIRGEGAIRLVRDDNFSGVAKKPTSGMDALISLGGGEKRSPPPVKLHDSDMLKKISVSAAQAPRLAVAAMPELGRKSGQDAFARIAAPVDYKIFKSSAVWLAFTDARGIKGGAHDFSAADLLILVSVSDFPNGIFKIDGVEKTAKETVVRYRVDPLAMAAGADPAAAKACASAAVPKRGPPIRLEQIP